MTSRCPSAVPTQDRGNAFSVSHILGLAAKQYAAAVLSNVRYCCEKMTPLASQRTREDAFGVGTYWEP